MFNSWQKVFGKDICVIGVPNSCTWFVAIRKKGNIWRLMTEEEEKEWKRVQNEWYEKEFGEK